MRFKWTLAPIALGFLYGCGGTKVEIAQYSMEIYEPAVGITVTDMVSASGGETIIGQFSGFAFAETGVHRGLGFPNLLSPSEDIISGANANGTLVGYDSSTTAGQDGLMGTTSTWGASNLGLTLGSNYMRIFAVAPNDTMGLIVFPPSGAGTVYRHVGTTNTALTNFTDFKPTSIGEINNSGKLCGVGGVGTVTTEQHAVMSDGNTLVDLGIGTANALNGAGIVVGQNEHGRPYRTVSGTSLSRAALPLLPNCTIGEATDINESGVIVGWQAVSDISEHIPVAWYENGALVDLRTRVVSPPANVALHDAVAITDTGTILIQGKRTDGGLTTLGVILRLQL